MILLLPCLSKGCIIAFRYFNAFMRQTVKGELEMKDFSIGFIGLGLIGGSIAKSIHRIFPDYRIVGFDNNISTLKEAVSDGTLTEYTDDVHTIAECNYIFLCAPVHYNIEYLRQLGPFLTDSTILTDVGSVKLDIYEAVQELGLARYFVGGHPMVGSERSGYEAATDRLIENAYYFITPADGVLPGKTEEFSKIGRAHV